VRRILLLILLLPLVRPGALSIYLHKSAFLEGEDYTLGEVAAIVSQDPAAAAVLEQLPLGATPKRITLLPGTAIRSRVASAVDGEFFVIGGRVALLPGAVVEAQQKRFFERFLRFIDSRDTLKQGTIEIELLSVPLIGRGGGDGFAPRATLATLASGWEDRIVFDVENYRTAGDSGKLAGQMQIGYRVLSPDGDQGAGGQSVGGSFRVWIHHFLPVARAAQDLSAGRLLNDELVYFSPEDISVLSSRYLLPGDPLDGYRTTAPITSGALIEPNRLQRDLAVRAGQRITIVFVRPGLRIAAQGRALRSGGMGDTIEVRPVDTGKRFTGRISGAGEVLVEKF
jgi:flagella basal body P-ring formation protein FlgA